MDQSILKKEFAKFWTKAVVFGERAPRNISVLSNQEVIDWAFATLMRCSEKILASWGILPDENLINRISKEKDVKFRSELEKIYIYNFQQKVKDYVFRQKAKTKYSSWNSWPATMLKNSRFNCAGASLLGIWMLKKAGIKVHAGLPIGHVVNPVQLSDGNWLYPRPEQLSVSASLPE